MPDDFPADNLKTIWQHQPIEASTMTSEKIRKKARELHARTRRQLLGTLVGPLAAVFCYVFGIKQFPSLHLVLQPLFALALVWSLVGLYFLNRGMWSPAIPTDAAFSDGLEFCRRELLRRRDYLRRVLLWSFGPVLLAIGTIIMALAMIGSSDRGIFPNGLPFLTLVAAWIIAWFVLRLPEQREIVELTDISRENNRT